MIAILIVLFVAPFSIDRPTDPTPADSNKITVSLDSVYVHPGTAFTVALRLHADSLEPFSAYQFSLSYDPHFIELDSVAASHTLSASSLISYHTPEPGLLNVAAASAREITEAGLLLNLMFHSRDVEGISYIRFASFQLHEGAAMPATRSSMVEISPLPAATPRIRVDSVYATVGEVASVGLYASDGTLGMFSGTVELTYDPDVVMPFGLTSVNTVLETSSGFADYAIVEDGLMAITFALPEPVSAADIPLLYVDFKGTPHPGETALTLTKAQLNESDQPVLFQHGLIRYALPFLWGDADLDQRITTTDARFILSHDLGTARLDGRAFLAADVSANQVVSSFDAALVLMYLYNYIGCFPADASCTRSVAKTFSAAGSYTNNPFRLPDTSPLLLTFAPREHDGAVYSLDVIFTLRSSGNSSGNKPDAFKFALPDSWIYDQTSNDATLALRMAGPSPLPAGVLLTLPHGSRHGIADIQVVINGTDRFTMAEEGTGDHVDDVALYPHPFHDQTRLAYTLPGATVLEISLYDMIGRRVETVFKGKQQAGRHHLSIDGTRLSPGVYALQVTDEAGDRYVRAVVKQ